MPKKPYMEMNWQEWCELTPIERHRWEEASRRHWGGSKSRPPKERYNRDGSLYHPPDCTCKKCEKEGKMYTGIYHERFELNDWIKKQPEEKQLLMLENMAALLSMARDAVGLVHDQALVVLKCYDGSHENYARSPEFSDAQDILRDEAWDLGLVIDSMKVRLGYDVGEERMRTLERAFGKGEDSVDTPG